MCLKRKLQLGVARGCMAGLGVLTTLLLSGCSEDGTRTVSVGDNEPVLELPEKLKNANPNIRALMEPVISYRIEGSSSTEFTVLQSVASETATSVDGSYPGVAEADAVTLPDVVVQSDAYDVKVEWFYPQQQEEDRVELGSIVYNIKYNDDTPPVRVAERGEEITDFGEETNPLGLNNIQLINSLYIGEDAVNIDLANVENLRPWTNYQAIEDNDSVNFPEQTVYIADYINSIGYEAVIGARWGVDDALKIKALEGAEPKVLEDFENVQLSAIGSDEAMYFQLVNLNPDGNPFEYQVEVAIDSPAANEPSPVVFTGDRNIFSENETTDVFDTQDMYAYRLNTQSDRLDYRQNRTADMPLVNNVSITFFEDNADGPQKIAEWGGIVLFGVKAEESIDQTGQVLELKVLSQNGAEIPDREFPECTPFIITAELNGIDETETVIYTFTHDYDGDFISGTIQNFDEGVAGNRKNYRLPPASDNEQYIYTINVAANVSGQPEAEAKTSSVQFTVNNEQDVEDVCPEN